MHSGDVPQAKLNGRGVSPGKLTRLPASDGSTINAFGPWGGEISTTQADLLNSVLMATGQKPITLKQHSTEGPPPAGQTKGVTQRTEYWADEYDRNVDGVDVENTWWSDGTRWGHQILNGCQTLITILNEGGNKPDRLFWVVDEVDKGLHLAAHRDILNLLIERAKQGIQLADGSTIPVQLFLTTHSQAVVAEALKHSDVSLYVLRDGKSVDPTKRSSPTCERGLRGERAKFAATVELGNQAADSLPKTFIIAEGSVLALLSAVAAANDEYEQWVSWMKNGDSAAAQAATAELSVTNSVIRHLKRFPFVGIGPVDLGFQTDRYQFDVILVVDSAVPDDAQIHVTQAETLGAKVLLLSGGDLGLEAIYPAALIEEFLKEMGLPTWDRTTKFKDYLLTDEKKLLLKKEEDGERQDETIGRLKRKMAEYVGGRLSLADFAGLFPGLATLCFGMTEQNTLAEKEHNDVAPSKEPQKTFVNQSEGAAQFWDENLKRNREILPGEPFPEGIEPSMVDSPGWA
jgi:hypothetical protein